jgi:YD repeat-containing protein
MSEKYKFVDNESMYFVTMTASWSTSFRDQWCFTYTYDAKGRLVEKKTPDAQPTYYCYDPLDRLALVQDANMRLSNQWLFIKYDIKGRGIMSGLYTNTTYTTRSALQLNVRPLHGGAKN